MQYHLAMIFGGIAAIFWGLPAAHRLKKPLDAFAALAVVAGLLVALFGILLTVVPGFFRG
jgi:hypothetical protein